MLDAEVTQVGRNFSPQIFRSHQPEVVVIGRLQTVVSVAPVSQQLETLGGAGPAGFFFLVPSLEDGQEVVRAPVSEFVGQKVAHSEAGEAALLHQPPEVGGGNCLRVEKRHRVESASGLLFQKIFEFSYSPHRLEVPAVVERYLASGSLRQVAPKGRVILNAEAEPRAGRIFLTNVAPLLSSLDRHEARASSVQNASNEDVRLDGFFDRGKPNGPGVGTAQSFGRQQTVSGVPVLGGAAVKGAGQAGPVPAAVNVRAARRDVVVECAAKRSHLGERFAQPPAKTVHPGRQSFRPGRAGRTSGVVQAVGVVTVVVPAGTVVIDVEESSRLALAVVPVEREQQIASLPRAPTQNLLSGARVNRRGSACGFSAGDFFLGPGVGDDRKVPPAAGYQVLNDKRLFRFSGISSPPFLDENCRAGRLATTVTRTTATVADRVAENGHAQQRVHVVC